MQPPETEAPQPTIQITLRGLSRRQLIWLISGLALSIMLALGAIIYIRQYTTLTGLPKDSYQNLSFQAYFPRPIPQNFKLDSNSVSRKSDVLAYTLMYQKSHPVYVSVQPLDPQLDINSFRPTRELTLSIGKGYLVEFDTRVTVAIVTQKSFILMNSNDIVPSTDMESLANTPQPLAN